MMDSYFNKGFFVFIHFKTFIVTAPEKDNQTEENFKLRGHRHGPGEHQQCFKSSVTPQQVCDQQMQILDTQCIAKNVTPGIDFVGLTERRRP